MEGKLIKAEKEYYALYNNKGVFISDVNGGSIANRLSLKNCEAIANGYDLDELISVELKKLPYEKHVDDGQYNDGQLAGFELGAEWGFQKALEILGDKKFSEDDMGNLWDFCVYNKGTFKEGIQSLQQTEWDVIVEMECPQCKEWGYISECRNNCNQKFLQPKLDADGCLILKRK